MYTAKNSINLSRYAKFYLMFVMAVFVISAIICIGLFCNVFGFVDEVNSYILAMELANSMIRMLAAAALMTVIIDFLARSSE